VIHLRSGDVEIEILEEVGQRPAIEGAQRQGRNALFREDIEILYN